MSMPELMPVSEPIRRLEVFTGAGRRRTWSAADKARIVAESNMPGASVCAVARRHGLTPQQVFTWRRLARRATHAGAEPDARPGDPMFAPVVVTAPAGAAPMIEVSIGPAVVRIPPGTDAASVRAVLRAVKGLR